MLLEAGAEASIRNEYGNTALDQAVEYGSHEVAACIRQASDEARRLCGARQRRAFATSLLASVEVAVGLRELPYDLLRCVCEAVAALGPPPANLVGMMPQLDELVYSL